MAISQFETSFKENFKRIMEENPIPDPPVRETVDLVAFQMEDMDERVAYLEKQVQENNYESKNDPEYKRIMEYCVRFAVDMDNINITGREDERAKRKELLVRLDGVSATLLKKCK